MMVRSAELSRAVSHALRHEPWLYELELDEEGWVSVDQLVVALREQGDGWVDVDASAIRRMLDEATKRRHELVDGRIRALYGHSLPGRIHKSPEDPPACLFHGTTPEAWQSIGLDGLRPVGRQYVHLSVDAPTAVSVGRRKSATPVLLTVEAASGAAAGASFYKGNDLVWLADSIDSSFVKITN